METLLLWLHIGLWIAFVLQSIFLLALVSFLGKILRRMRLDADQEVRNVLRLGERIPPVTFPLLGGGRIEVSLANNRNVLLLCLSPGCSVCRLLVPELRRLSGIGLDWDVLLVVPDHGDPSRKYAESLTSTGHSVALPTPNELLALGIMAFPYMLAVSKDGVLTSQGVINRIEAVIQIISEEAALSSAD